MRNGMKSGLQEKDQTGFINLEIINRNITFKVMQLCKITLGGIILREEFPGLNPGAFQWLKMTNIKKGSYKAKDTEKVHSLRQDGELGEVVNWRLSEEIISKRKE